MTKELKKQADELLKKKPKRDSRAWVNGRKRRLSRKKVLTTTAK